MLDKLQRLWRIDWLSTLRFNLHYFPLRVACRLPVLLYGARIVRLDGEVVLQGPIRTGMVKLGWQCVPVFKSQFNFIYENGGGKLTFTNRAFLGEGSCLSLQRGAEVCLGDEFTATSGLRLIAARSITVGHRCLVGWNVTIMDTSWHALRDTVTGQTAPTEAPIRIGHSTWISSDCKIYKGAVVPDGCVVAAGTVLTKDISAPSCSLIAGALGRVVRHHCTLATD